MRDTLICTVGTSVMGNMERAEEGALKRYFADRNARGAAAELCRLAPDERRCGAEINSLWSIVQERLAEPRELYLLVSDTEAGRFTGEVLTYYFSSGRSPFRFDRVRVRVLEGLTDADIHRFRRDGLRNLVRAVSRIVRAAAPERVLINATGGYKAQISFAGMIGQALEIPVCYLFERFSRVIQLPPQPVSLDLSFWLTHADLFFELDEGMEGEAPPELSDERFACLVESVETNGGTLTALSPTGQLFHETFRRRFAVQKAAVLPPDSGVAPEHKKIRFEDDNRGKHPGLEHYLKKLLGVPYVKEIYTHYSHPDLPRKNRFRRSSKGLAGQIEGWFSNARRLTKFDLITTARTEGELQAAVADLTERFVS